MLDLTAKIVVAGLGAHALVKFAVLLLLPYRRRRAALDRAYGTKASATRASDAALLLVVVGVSGLLLWRGLEPVSFLGGLWVGATLIQLYFHRFHTPLAADQAPPAVVSPIKMMSYAIQATPTRPWREMIAMATLVILALVLLIGGAQPRGLSRAQLSPAERDRAGAAAGRQDRAEHALRPAA